VPFILEMLSKDEKGSSLLREMDLVSTGGAPLPESVGDSMVERGMHLVSRLGSSECGFLMSSWRDFKTDKAWSWLRVTDPRSKKWLLFQPQGEGDPLHELIVSSDWPAKVRDAHCPPVCLSTDCVLPRSSRTERTEPSPLVTCMREGRISPITGATPADPTTA
jgi:hypothetical protein